MIDMRETLSAAQLCAEATLPAGFDQSISGDGMQPPAAIGDRIEDGEVSMLLAQRMRSVVCLLEDGQAANRVVKFYMEERSSREELLQRVSHIREAALMPVLSFGRYRGISYEILPYQKGVCLQGMTLPESTIIEHIIPQLDAALHALHAAGVYHNDIKPANLYWDEQQKLLVLGDFGSISPARGDMPVGGTPEYMAPESLYSGGKVHSRASDYCMMGLTLAALLSGESPLRGKSRMAMLRAWQQGIALPNGISARMSLLIGGLIKYDPAARMTHEEIRIWIEGKSAKAKEKRKRDQQDGMRPLYFADACILEIQELVEAAGRDWKLATFMLRQHQLDSFLMQFGREKYLLSRQCSNRFDIDEGLFILLRSLQPTTEFFWKGCSYTDIGDFAERALQEGRVYGDSPYAHFCRSGMLEVYYRSLDASEEKMRFAAQIVRQAQEDPELALAQLLGALNAKPEMTWHGEVFRTMDDLARWILGSENDLDACVRELFESKKLEAWLSFIGQGRFIGEIKAGLEQVII